MPQNYEFIYVIIEPICLINYGVQMSKGNSIILFLSAILITSCAMFGNNSQPITQYINSAKYNLANQQASIALESSIRAIKLDHNNAEAYYLAAQAYQQLKDSNNANINYQSALKLNNKSESMLVSYANFLCAAQNYPQAQGLYNRALNNALQTHTTPTAIYTAYADCQTSQNQLDPAISNYIEALRDESAPLSAYVGISYTYILQKNFATAYYYIGLYQGKDNAQSLQIKITILKALLASSIMLPDRQKLQTALTNNQRALLAIQANAPVKPPESQTVLTPMIDDTLVADKTSLEITESTVAKSAPIIVVNSALNSSNNKKSITNNTLRDYSPLQTTTAKDGRHYIIVKSGDTLYNIAQRSKTTQAKLLKLNQIKMNEVQLGSKLYLD